MLNQIKGFFDQHVAPLWSGAQQEPHDTEHRIRLAVGALLLEMARMSEGVLPEEEEAVDRAVRERFGLTEEESERLIELAETERREATDYFQFTSLINTQCTQQQRAELVEALWRIAYADASLHRYEEHLVRKISQLLHVPHPTFVAAKHRAEQGAQGEG